MSTDRLFRATTLSLAVMAAAACGGPGSVVGPVDERGLGAELNEAFAVVTSVAFGEVGRGVLYADILGGRGVDALQRNAGSVFRWNEPDQRYERTQETGPPNGVRFVLYAALQAVPFGAPLVETGFIDYLVDPSGVRAVLVTEVGDRLDLTFTGDLPIRRPYTWEITGQVERAGASYEFDFSVRVTSDDDGTMVRSASWRGPEGLRVDLQSHTTHIYVFGGETSHQELVILSRHGRAEMTGLTVGGTGEHELSIGGRPVAKIVQLAELWPDFIEYIAPTPGTELNDSLEALARQVFRTRNHLSLSVLLLVTGVVCCE